MVNPQGTFIWYELMTTDPDAGADFYAGVVGWDVQRFEIPGGSGPEDYRIFSSDADGAGGLMRIPAGAPMQPGWLGYIGVDDVDATVAAIKADGGAAHMPPTTLAGVGRMAMVADPQGVVFYVMRGASEEDSNAFGRTAMRRVCWNELATPDPARALSFYGTHFGYAKEGAMPMGAAGEYAFIAHQGSVIGAVMPSSATTRPMWRFYIRVPEIEVAKAKVEAFGGTIVHGPQQVPGGDFVLDAIDPHGAAFGLAAPAR